MAKLPMGELEAQVMDVLWDADGWLTPREVYEAFSRRHPIGYTTAMTILVRLWQKGRVERRPEGRAYAYFPTATREEHVAARMRDVLDSSADHGAALTHFLHSLAPGDRARLRRMLQRRKSS
ncbi:MAG TPA: BlaI/MecI/CopY family transcriptional regulator [Acidimicrobiia bacterium]